jgi:hypothetical protein
VDEETLARLSNMSVGDYFFPDLGSLANFTANYETEAAPALDSVLGFDEGRCRSRRWQA